MIYLCVSGVEEGTMDESSSEGEYRSVGGLGLYTTKKRQPGSAYFAGVSLSL